MEPYNHGEIAVELRPGEHFLSQLLLMPISTPLTDDEAHGARPDHIFAKQTKPIPTD